MDTAHVTDLLPEYIENDLPIARRQQVEAHLTQCPDCQQDLVRFKRLSALLQSYTLPNRLTAAETFRAQVMLRISRRRDEGPSLAWYAVPLGVGSLLLVLESLIVIIIALLGILGWSSLPAILTALSSWIHWSALEAWLGHALISPLIGLFNMISGLFLYIILFLLFIPYIGWVGLLLRKSKASLPHR